MISLPDDIIHSTDEVLVKLAQSGVLKAEKLLIERYRETVKITAAALASSFAAYCALASLEFDDLFQEGLLGLLSAIYSFRDDKNTAFRTFASKCISNNIKTAIRSATREKNTPKGGVVSLNDIDIPSVTSLEDSIISREGASGINTFLKTELSELEFSVIRLYLADNSYREIARKLSVSEKTVDNAIQRIRGKLSKFLNNK